PPSCSEGTPGLWPGVWCLARQREGPDGGPGYFSEPGGAWPGPGRQGNLCAVGPVRPDDARQAVDACVLERGGRYGRRRRDVPRRDVHGFDRLAPTPAAPEGGPGSAESPVA